MQQIDQMITEGADLLIIAAIDGTALSSQLQAAADAKIPVISYDRLIRDTENVDFYVSFDNYKVGVAQGTALLAGLGITNKDGSKGNAKGPFNIELFAGSLDDNNADVLLQRRDGHPQALHRRRHARREVGPDQDRAGRHPALGSRRPPRSAWRTS